jgi:hypothetical protein
MRKDGGTLRPLGMVMLPKSTKKATHHTDSQSGANFTKSVSAGKVFKFLKDGQS